VSSKILIRYNTKHGDSDLVWRVFIDGVEHLASNLEITGDIYTEKTIEDGVTKFNIACEGVPKWDGTVLKINTLWVFIA
jgi:hypothetical protein